MVERAVAVAESRRGADGFLHIAMRARYRIVQLHALRESGGAG